MVRALVGHIEGVLMNEMRKPISLTFALILGAGLTEASTVLTYPVLLIAGMELANS